MSQRVAFTLVILGAVLWGTTGTAQTFMPQSVHPLAIGAVRLGIGGFSLVFILLVMKKISFRNWPWKATFFAALSMAIFQYCFFSSIRLTGIAIGTVVAIGSAPAFAGMIDWLFLKEKPTKIWMLSTILAVGGTALLFANKEDVIVHPLGVVFSLCAGLLFAWYALFNKEIVGKVEAMPAVAIIFSMSALLLMPFLVVFETTDMFTRSGIITVLYLGIVTTTIAYLLFSLGLQKIPSSSAVTLSLVEPLTATLLSVFIVGEVLSLTSWGGILLLIGGILVLTISGKKMSHREQYSSLETK